MACDRCNAYKGPNLSSLDPQTGLVVELFHPRNQVWQEHFAFQSVNIMGLTPIGRATVGLLKMNDERRRTLRAELIALGDLRTDEVK